MAAEEATLPNSNIRQRFFLGYSGMLWRQFYQLQDVSGNLSIITRENQEAINPEKIQLGAVEKVINRNL